jgi:hypothetical protein
MLLALMGVLGGVDRLAFAEESLGVRIAQDTVLSALPDALVEKALEAVWTHVPGAERRRPEGARRSALGGYLQGQIPGLEMVAEAGDPGRGEGTAAGAPSQGVEFYAEVLPDRVGYVRIGALKEEMLGALDAVLGDWLRLGVARAVVDLRLSGMGGTLDLAAKVAGRFVPPRQSLFAVRSGSLPSAVPVVRENAWASPWSTDEKVAPVKLLIVLVGGKTAGPVEAVAAVLRAQARAVLVGHPTRGLAADFVEIPLEGHGRLRVPTAEPVWMPFPADSGPVRTLLGHPLLPDVRVAESVDGADAVLQEEVRVGKVASFVAEGERLRASEAALVAGRNPELEETLRAVRASKTAASTGAQRPRDSGLRVALDFFKAWEVLRPR